MNLHTTDRREYRQAEFVMKKLMAEQNLTRIIVHRGGLACGALVSSLYAGPLPLGIVGRPIDLSANVSDTTLPGGSPFQEPSLLFGTAPDPVQSAELPPISTGTNPTPRSNISDAFASSLAQSNGNGGVGVSQVIFGSPGALAGSPASVPEPSTYSLMLLRFLDLSAWRWRISGCSPEQQLLRPAVMVCHLQECGLTEPSRGARVRDHDRSDRMIARQA